MTSALTQAEFVRCDVVQQTSEEVRRRYSQYLTPYETARYAAGMFDDSLATPNCLDLGGGTGILSVALAARFPELSNIDVVELDESLARVCDEELSEHDIPHRVFVEDAIRRDYPSLYDKVILNPPYKKMAADDSRQSLLPVKAANLYSAFVMRAVEALTPGGECVAIIPRSWTNGDYFAAFRTWVLERCSIEWMHIYGSRTEVFADTNVLQETMLIKLKRGAQFPTVKVTESVGKLDDATERVFVANDLIGGSDTKYVVRLRPPEPPLGEGMASLKQSGYLASTGKVVDFRSREKIKPEREEGCAPLVYSCNFGKNGFTHPVNAGKMQWFFCETEKDRRLLIGPGSFVVVKRFSSKEEQKRIKAFVLTVDEPVALENHQNFIHAGTSRKVVPLEAEIAHGLAIWLNSTVIDQWFRARSGSTQVNASDLNQAPVPNCGHLKLIGRKWSPELEQGEIDKIAEGILNG